MLFLQLLLFFIYLKVFVFFSSLRVNVCLKGLFGVTFFILLKHVSLFLKMQMRNCLILELWNSMVVNELRSMLSKFLSPDSFI